MTRFALLALTLITAACTEEPSAPATEQGGAASGEVLERSISDAMIPLDQLESQAPLAPRQAVPVGTIDDEQPEVEPAPGIDGPPASQGAEAAPAAPAPDASE
jgi:hypothetical protein